LLGRAPYPFEGWFARNCCVNSDNRKRKNGKRGVAEKDVAANLPFAPHLYNFLRIWIVQGFSHI
jgi:hypothetical protein